MENETHRQCPDCLAWVPKSWEKDSHTCPPFLKDLVQKKKDNSPTTPEKWEERFTEFFNHLVIQGAPPEYIKTVKDFISAERSTAIAEERDRVKEIVAALMPHEPYPKGSIDYHVARTLEDLLKDLSNKE